MQHDDCAAGLRCALCGHPEFLCEGNHSLGPDHLHDQSLGVWGHHLHCKPPLQVAASRVLTYGLQLQDYTMHVYACGQSYAVLQVSVLLLDKCEELRRCCPEQTAIAVKHMPHDCQQPSQRLP